MNDKELLELAAKAGGLQVKGWVGDRMVFFNPITQSGEEHWNPLEDDGDALRLVVGLRINLGQLQAGISWDHPDRYSVTRRAIVVAAAEIGKSL